ncbi:MAG: hypothetical protein VYC39_13355 [Myxococcota bacterium]|nr:hypothetical protein [Myxococcota bacterium]
MRSLIPSVVSLRLSLAAALSFSLLTACSKSPENQAAKKKIWNNEIEVSDLEKASKEKLDASKLAANTKVKDRILRMTAQEAMLRHEPFEYKGKARIIVGGRKRRLDVTEKTKITVGLHGSFSVQQKDAEDKPTRALVYNNGTMFIRNGSGDMRAQGIVNNQHLGVLEEAWEPLSVFSSYFGSRFTLKSAGIENFNKREVFKYEISLGEGPDLIESKDGDRAKKPLSLSGSLLVDTKTAVVLKASLKGKLEVPSAKAPTSTVAAAKKEPKAGTIIVRLDYALRSIEAQEQRPSKFIDAIRRHPTDLNPLAFMKSDTRTSTVIGGAKKKQKKPAAKKTKK